jgi:hypothetical protein
VPVHWRYEFGGRWTGKNADPYYSYENASSGESVGNLASLVPGLSEEAVEL